MARKARAEVEGGLYHVLTRGNNRRPIFNAPTDCEKFLSLLAIQKPKLPFFLYAYCLMTNHVHLLIERQQDNVGRIMHRLLTGYSQYYNRRYHRVGHLLQGRHKAILCESERYLAELVRYIHLNPVRAQIVKQPEQYAYSSHRAYLGLEPAGIVDVDPVLRHFGSKKKDARQHYREFVMAGMSLGHQDEYYCLEEGRILGSEEFVDATIHRLGESRRSGQVKGQSERSLDSVDVEALIRAVEIVCVIDRKSFCGPGKSAHLVRAKEALIVVGTRVGASNAMLSTLIKLNSSTVSRRLISAEERLLEPRRRSLIEQIEKHYWKTRT